MAHKETAHLHNNSKGITTFADNHMKTIMQDAAQQNVCPDCLLQYLVAFCMMNMLAKEAGGLHKIESADILILAAESANASAVLIEVLKQRGASEVVEFSAKPVH
jgi:hypothetical protein